MRTTELLKKVFSQPTAPFREFWVLDQIQKILELNKISYFYDKSKNLIAGAKNSRELKQARMVFMAHTDHPGFHIQKKIRPNTYRALWFGGAPFKQMKGAKLAVYHHLLGPHKISAQVTNFPQKKYTREGMPFEIKTAKPLPIVEGSFGAFDFPAIKISKNKITTRVADDLAGVVIILGTLLDLRKRGLVGVFTRAEEVGFVGCWALMASGILDKNTAIVSLEASRTLPGAEVGRGPILRIGDASTIFNSELAIQMWESALALKKRQKKFTFQRRLMDGGSCEATAANLFGYKATGIAVPLVNYHNQGSKGPAPEIVNLSDVEGARILCVEFGKHVLGSKSNVMLQRFQRLQKNYNNLRSLLYANNPYRQ